MADFHRSLVKLSYRDSEGPPASSEPPILLTHGIMGSADVWTDVAAEMNESRRIISLELRGHGDSGPVRGDCCFEDLVDDISALLDHLKIPKVVLAGCGLGGSIAMRAAAALQDRVAGLFTVNADAASECAKKKKQYRTFASAVQLMPPRSAAIHMVRHMFSKDTLKHTPELAVRWVRSTAKMDSFSAFRMLEAHLARPDGREIVKTIRCPSLFVVSSEDTRCGWRRGREVASLVEGSSFQVVDKAGHLVMMEKPRAIVELLKRLLSISSPLTRGETDATSGQ